MATFTNTGAGQKLDHAVQAGGSVFNRLPEGLGAVDIDDGNGVLGAGQSIPAVGALGEALNSV